MKTHTFGDEIQRVAKPTCYQEAPPSLVQLCLGVYSEALLCRTSSAFKRLDPHTWLSYPVHLEASSLPTLIRRRLWPFKLFDPLTTLNPKRCPLKECGAPSLRAALAGLREGLQEALI
ncbi:hypothetical protein E2C01_056469 [Portunus trituberculatus]|uniref:Uncharacterized protein n=1 Tax=Portunus trituberculatus TaxID=210409 RepID=A0A5B7H0L8_PORTR|nr:hypothetical protein [Portunus trituberculatus]